MMEKIFNEDADNTMRLKLLPKFQEIFSQYEPNIDEETEKYQKDMIKLHHEKVRIITYCEQVLHEAERDAERESIKLIQAFESKKKNIYRKIDSQKSTEDLHQYEDALKEDINVLEDELIQVEMRLQEQLQESTANYEDRVKRVINEMQQTTESL